MSGYRVFAGHRRGWVALAAALALITAAGLDQRAPADAATPSVFVFPVPGAHVAAPESQITFRGVPAGQLGSIAVSGSRSGIHPGSIHGDSDGDGASFIPQHAFTPGERVTVQTGLNIVGAHHGTFTFTVATPSHGIRTANPAIGPRIRGDVWRYVSRPDLVPAAVQVHRRSRAATPGGVFVASQEGPVQNGPELLGQSGGLIWFQPVPRGDSATDFREQTYRGQPVLTWWQGRVSTAGVGAGEGEIYDRSYRPLATVRAANGLQADLHEFQITPQNTALVTAYYPVIWNASKIKHGSRRQIVLDAVVQEIDIPTGLVLYQWDSLDHVALGDSHQPVPTVNGHPWDYFHINSVQPLSDGDLVISARNIWAGYLLSHQTGKIHWTLGGKRSSFRMASGAAFAFQHDIRLHGADLVTLFDDGAGPPVIEKQSRALTLRLDFKDKVARVVHQAEHQPRVLAAYEGNLQQLAGGHEMVGWGQQPYMTEFDARGRVVFDAAFVGPTSSYRAYRFAWQATPADPPAVTVRQTGRRRIVWMSWNGATAVSRWRVLGGPTATALKPIAFGRRRSFETGIQIPHRYGFVAVAALNGHGQVLGTSRPVRG